LLPTKTFSQTNPKVHHLLLPRKHPRSLYNSKAKTEGIRRALQKFALKKNPYSPPVTKHYNQYNCGEISPFRNVVFQTKKHLFWLVVSTHLKNISQNGNLPPNRGENKKSVKPPPSYCSPGGWPLFRLLAALTKTRRLMT